MLGKVEEWKGSGLSMMEYARSNGFSKSVFRYWVKKNRKSNVSTPVSFVELAPAVRSKDVVEVSSDLRGPVDGQGSIVITFPSGMSVKIYG